VNYNLESIAREALRYSIVFLLSFGFGIVSPKELLTYFVVASILLSTFITRYKSENLFIFVSGIAFFFGILLSGQQYSFIDPGVYSVLYFISVQIKKSIKEKLNIVRLLILIFFLSSVLLVSFEVLHRYVPTYRFTLITDLLE